jgi:hypothetical protein
LNNNHIGQKYVRCIQDHIIDEIDGVNILIHCDDIGEAVKYREDGNWIVSWACGGETGYYAEHELDGVTEPSDNASYQQELVDFLTTMEDTEWQDYDPPTSRELQAIDEEVVDELHEDILICETIKQAAVAELKSMVRTKQPAADKSNLKPTVAFRERMEKYFREAADVNGNEALMSQEVFVYTVADIIKGLMTEGYIQWNE